MMNSPIFDHLDAHRDQVRDPAFEDALWERFGSVHTVVVVDMAGFTITSREKGILYFLSLIQDMRSLTKPLVEAANGKVVKFEADNLYVIFDKPADAMAFVTEANRATAALNADRERVEQVRLCVGVDHGRILVDGNDFYGNAVNMASKLGEDMARDGEVLVTQDIVDQLHGSEFHFEDIGSHGFFGSDLPVFQLRQGLKEEAAS